VAGLVRDRLGRRLLVAVAEHVVEHQRGLVVGRGVVEHADVGDAAAAAVVDTLVVGDHHRGAEALVGGAAARQGVGGRLLRRHVDVEGCVVLCDVLPHLLHHGAFDVGERGRVAVGIVRLGSERPVAGAAVPRRVGDEVAGEVEVDDPGAARAAVQHEGVGQRPDTFAGHRSVRGRCRLGPGQRFLGIEQLAGRVDPQVVLAAQQVGQPLGGEPVVLGHGGQRRAERGDGLLAVGGGLDDLHRRGDGFGIALLERCRHGRLQGPDVALGRVQLDRAGGRRRCGLDRWRIGRRARCRAPAR